MTEKDQSLWVQYAAAVLGGVLSRYPLSGRTAEDLRDHLEHVGCQAACFADEMLKRTPKVGHEVKPDKKGEKS